MKRYLNIPVGASRPPCSILSSSLFPFLLHQGSGVKPGSKVNTCKTCRGQGMVTQVTRTPLGNFQTQSVCPECGGSGQVVEEYCGSCSGQGRLEKTKQIKVDIPA